VARRKTRNRRNCRNTRNCERGEFLSAAQSEKVTKRKTPTEKQNFSVANIGDRGLAAAPSVMGPIAKKEVWEKTSNVTRKKKKFLSGGKINQNRVRTLDNNTQETGVGKTAF